MAAKKISGTSSGETTAKKKSSTRTAAKKSAPRKSASAAGTSANNATQKPVATGDRLTGVARTIGSTVGGIVTKTKKVVNRVQRGRKEKSRPGPSHAARGIP